jgi:hypothetical protein
MQSSELYHRVVRYVGTDISEISSVSIFRAEDGASSCLKNIGTYLPTNLHRVTTQTAVARIAAVIRISDQMIRSRCMIDRERAAENQRILR